jgi:hypothetical protein
MLGVLACYLPNALFHEMTIIPMVQVFLLTAGGVIVSVAQRGFAVDAATRMAAPRRQRLATATQPAS